jgi:phosphonate transport system substrate-binding protein
MAPGPLRAVALLAAVLLAPVSAPASDAAGVAPLRLGVVTFYNPRLMYLKYQPLVDYLTETTSSHWELAISSSYESTVQALCDGRLAVAYLGPLTYVRARELCGAVPVVKLATHGSPTFESVIVVREDSGIRSLSDLRGKSFGFGSPLSTSSHIMPRAVLERAGLRPGADVQCRYFMHHESAARAVLMREVDAAGVRDIVADEFAKRGLRVLHRSDPLPNFPFVAGPKAPASVMREMVHALVIRPTSDPVARARIASWDEELAGGFTHAATSEFEPLRVLGERMFGPRWTLVPERVLQCGGSAER